MYPQVPRAHAAHGLCASVCLLVVLVGDCLVLGPPPGQPSVVTAVFLDGYEGYPVYRIPAIVHVRNNVLVAFAEARRTTSDTGHVDIAMKRSWDGGRSWSPLRIVAGHPDGPYDDTHGNVVPIVDPTKGVLHVIFCVNNTRVVHMLSTDAGDNFTPKRDISHMVTLNGWGWVATGPGHGVATKSGRLLVPFNAYLADAQLTTRTRLTGCPTAPECNERLDNSSIHVYYKVQNTKDPDEQPLTGALDGMLPPSVAVGDRSGIMYSDDDGATWQLGGQLTEFPGSSEAIVAEVTVRSPSGVPRSELLLSFRSSSDLDGGCRHMSRSPDNGLSFQAPFMPAVENNITELPCIPSPDCQGSLLALADADGVLLASGPGDLLHRQNLTIHLSTDGGLNFDPLIQIKEGSSGYSDLVSIESKQTGWSVGVLVESTDLGVSFARFSVPRPPTSAQPLPATLIVTPAAAP